MKKFVSVLVLLFIVLLSACDKVDTNIENYLNTSQPQVTEQAEKAMPSLETIGNYQDIEYWYGSQKVLFLESHAFLLKVFYSAEEYDKKLEELQQEYVFLEEPVQYSQERFLLPQNKFELDGYTFQVVKQKEGWEAVYPKDFMMIGFSDEKKSLVYLYFYDENLDYISSEEEPKSMEEFVQEYFDF